MAKFENQVHVTRLISFPCLWRKWFCKHLSFSIIVQFKNSVDQILKKNENPAEISHLYSSEEGLKCVFASLCKSLNPLFAVDFIIPFKLSRLHFQL